MGLCSGLIEIYFEIAIRAGFPGRAAWKAERFVVFFVLVNPSNVVLMAHGNKVRRTASTEVGVICNHRQRSRAALL